MQMCFHEMALTGKNDRNWCCLEMTRHFTAPRRSRAVAQRSVGRGRAHAACDHVGVAKFVVSLALHRFQVGIL